MDAGCLLGYIGFDVRGARIAAGHRNAVVPVLDEEAEPTLYSSNGGKPAIPSAHHFDGAPASLCYRAGRKLTI